VRPVPLRRGLLWGLLVAVLLAVMAAAVWSRLARPWGRRPPPPVIGRVPDFDLTNRDGRAIGRRDLAGSPWIADFIFTRCAASCPMMTSRMVRLERDLPPRLGVRMVSFTVDPGHDTPAVLDRYAAEHGAPDHWLFLTGDQGKIHRLSREGFKLAVDPTPSPDTAEPILHSTRFVLVDAAGAIRGYYDAFDEAAMNGLKADLEALAGESR
jgi:protein SCO1